MIGRRSFLRILGLAAPGAPLAAKAAVDAEIAKLAIPGNYPSALAGVAKYGLGDLGPAAQGQIAPKDWVHPHIQMGDYIKLFGRLPQHVEQNVRNRSQYVTHLDPDIANKRSWSMSVKIATQRQRNYEREVERYQNMSYYERAQQGFFKLAGFRWDY